MSPDELFEATHGWWKLGPNREKARYAFAISKGVIRAAYVITPGSWRKRQEGDRGWVHAEAPRWGFEGTSAHDETGHLVNRNVKAWFKTGARGHITYVNCD
jgi:hypothetical protein